MNEEEKRGYHPMDMFSQMVFEKDFYDLNEDERRKLFKLTDEIKNEVMNKLREIE